MIKTCVICHKQFKCIQAKAIFCSFPCKREGRRIRAREYARAKTNKGEQMDNDKAKRDCGKAWERTCASCGISFWSNAHNRKYCDDCAKMYWKRVKKPQQTYADTANTSAKAKKTEQPAGTVKCNEKVMQKCEYGQTCGGRYICNYLEIEKHSRGCHPSACDKYRKQTKKRGTVKLTLYNRQHQKNRKEAPSQYNGLAVPERRDI